MEKWCQSCDDSASRKVQRHVTVGNFTSILQKRHLSGSPLTSWDPKTSIDNEYLIEVMDNFTKWTEDYPYLYQEALESGFFRATVGIKILAHPCRFIPTNEKIWPLLYSKDCVNFSALTKSKQRLYIHNQMAWLDGLNRTILNKLPFKVSRNKQDWEQKLPLFMLAYRSAVHETYPLYSITNAFRS